MKTFILLMITLSFNLQAASFDQQVLNTIIDRVEHQYDIQDYQTLELYFSGIDSKNEFKEVSQKLKKLGHRGQEIFEEIKYCHISHDCHSYIITHEMELYGARKLNLYFVLINSDMSYQELKLKL